MYSRGITRYLLKKSVTTRLPLFGSDAISFVENPRVTVVTGTIFSGLIFHNSSLVSELTGIP